MGVWEVAGPGRGWDRDAHRSHSGENPKAKLAEPERDERRPGDRQGRELQVALVVSSTTVNTEGTTGRESADAHSSGARPRPPVGPRHPRAIRHADPRRVLRVFQLQAGAWAGGGGTICESGIIDLHRPSTHLDRHAGRTHCRCGTQRTVSLDFTSAHLHHPAPSCVHTAHWHCL
jgi:hypothetical protein